MVFMEPIMHNQEITLDQILLHLILSYRVMSIIICIIAKFAIFYES